MCQALVGNYREEHVFALTQALELYDVYQTKVAACDKQIQAILTRLKQTVRPPANKLLAARRRTRQPNAPASDARSALYAILGVDLTQIDGLGPYLALKLVGEWSRMREFRTYGSVPGALSIWASLPRLRQGTRECASGRPWRRVARPDIIFASYEDFTSIANPLT